MLAVAARVRFDHVKRVAGFRGADLGGIDTVVAELLFRELVLCVATLAVGRHAGRIKFDLHLHIRGRHVQRAGELAGKLRRRFLASAIGPTESVLEITTMPISESVPCQAVFDLAPASRPDE